MNKYGNTLYFKRRNNFIKEYEKYYFLFVFNTTMMKYNNFIPSIEMDTRYSLEELLILGLISTIFISIGQVSSV